MSDIFVSYKREDKDRIQPIVRGLKAVGLDVFTDYDSLPPGKSWIEGLIIKVRMARCVVGCWTHNSVNSQGLFSSENVQAEHQEGRGKLLPAILDRGCMPFSYDASQGVDLSNWSGDYNDEAWVRFAVAAKAMCTPRFVQHDLASAERKQAEVANLLQSMKSSYESAIQNIHELEIELSGLQGKYHALEAQVSQQQSSESSENGQKLKTALAAANDALDFERLSRKKLEEKVWELEEELHDLKHKSSELYRLPSLSLGSGMDDAISTPFALSAKKSKSTKSEREPTMEEILASIRKILDDDKKTPRK